MRGVQAPMQVTEGSPLVEGLRAGGSLELATNPSGCWLWLYFQAPEKPRSGEIRWPSGSVLAHAARHRVRAIQPEVLPQRRAGPRTGRADRDQQFAKQCAAGHRGRRSLRFAVGVGGGRALRTSAARGLFDWKKSKAVGVGFDYNRLAQRARATSPLWRAICLAKQR